jgi:hypothetical protein
MHHSDNLSEADYIGMHGKVSSGILPGCKDSGTVTIYAAGCSKQISARCEEALPPGADVVVVEAIGDREFLVKKA